ncbi:hypothetical protein C8Q73DRAFT_228842 [Cubamyces lactineus]|nr:hypothetical protein C8Q73DRAFT_228842 [Cubamyces lactineus]
MPSSSLLAVLSLSSSIGLTGLYRFPTPSLLSVFFLFLAYFSVHQRPQYTLSAAHKYVIAPASSSSFGSSARTSSSLTTRNDAPYFLMSFHSSCGFCSFCLSPLPQRPTRLFCSTASRLNPFLSLVLVICSRNLPRPICALSCANLSPAPAIYLQPILAHGRPSAESSRQSASL